MTRPTVERARAEQTARLAELDRAQAVTAERNRMARELHDVIANHLSAIAIHATAAAVGARTCGPSSATDALRVIRENSVLGLAEMRAMVELLRDPGERVGRQRRPGRGWPMRGVLAERAPRRPGCAVDLAVRRRSRAAAGERGPGRATASCRSP